MAIIGRIACPLCDFDAAHVKRNDDKLPYAHCPECGMVSMQCKTKTHERMLMGKMRPLPAAAAAAPKPEPMGAPMETPASTPAPAPIVKPAARPSFWSQMSGAKP